VGEVSCEQETGNAHDPHDSNVQVVGYVPRTISSVCSIFIRRGGSIVCTITGSREYSSDLENGGLQIPCLLTFSIDNHEEYRKMRKLFKILCINAYEVNEPMETGEVLKSCASIPEAAEPVSCSSVTHDKQKADFVPIDLTHFTKDTDVHFPLKKKSKVFDLEGIINCPMMKSILLSTC